MSATELHECFQWVCAYLGGFGALVAFVAALWMSPFGRHCRETLAGLVQHFRRQGVFGKMVVAFFVAGMVQYGATKGFWTRVAHDGGDDILTVTGIYTAVSNVVDETVSPPVTNKVPMVRVEWLGNGGTVDTPVSIRQSETNHWAEVEKIDPVITQEGITNVLQFATSTNLAGTAYWWFGTDLPAIIVTEEGIEIKEFEQTTKFVRFRFACGEQEATEFFIRRRKVGAADWEIIGSVPAHYGYDIEFKREMFTVDTDYDWSIVTTIEEGGDQ